MSLRRAKGAVSPCLSVFHFIDEGSRCDSPLVCQAFVSLRRAASEGAVGAIVPLSFISLMRTVGAIVSLSFSSLISAADAISHPSFL